MNPTFRAALAALAALLLTACASTPPPPQPPLPVPKPGEAWQLGRAKSLDATNHTVMHLDAERNQLYIQNFGGGGVALGLMGPFGVAANIGMIESNTKADVAQLQGKLQVRPREAFAEAVRRSGGRVAADAVAVATPYLHVVKGAPERVHLAAALIVEGGEGTAAWRRTYLYQLDETQTVASLAAFDAAAGTRLQRQLEAGYSELLAQIASETAATIAAEAPVLVTSEFITPRFEFEFAAQLVKRDAQRVWVRNFGGVTAVRTDLAKVVAQSPRK